MAQTPLSPLMRPVATAEGSGLQPPNFLAPTGTQAPDFRVQQQQPFNAQQSIQQQGGVQPSSVQQSGLAGTQLQAPQAPTAGPLLTVPTG